MASGPYSTFNVRLFRDGLQTPWGFRLQGGQDFKQPLTIQRVFTGSPAEGELQRGDIIVAIENVDTDSLIHKQAQDLISKSGGSLNLQIKSTRKPSDMYSRRNNPGSHHQPGGHHLVDGGGYHGYPGAATNYHSGHYGPPHQQEQHHQYNNDYSGGYHHAGPKPTMRPPQQPQFIPQQTPTQPKPYSPQHQPHYGGGGPSFGLDYSRKDISPTRPRQDPSMINKVQQSLDSLVVHDEEDYDFKSVRERKQAFTAADQRPKYGVPQTRRPAGSSGKRWKPPPSTITPPEFGWAPKKRPHAPGYAPPSQEPEPVFKQPGMVPVNRPVSGDYSHQPHHHHGTPHGASGEVVDDEFPAWKGTLKSSHSAFPGSSGVTPAGGHRSVQFQPQQPSRQQQGRPVDNQQLVQDLAADSGVANLQYNTPINMYSKANVVESMRGQTGGQSEGFKTQGPDGKDQYDWGKSAVYQMLQEEKHPQRTAQWRSPDEYRQQQQHHGGHGGPGDGFEDEVGASDF